jgi:hypothetical protein
MFYLIMGTCAEGFSPRLPGLKKLDILTQININVDIGFGLMNVYLGFPNSPVPDTEHPDAA